MMLSHDGLRTKTAESARHSSISRANPSDLVFFMLSRSITRSLLTRSQVRRSDHSLSTSIAMRRELAVSVPGNLDTETARDGPDRDDNIRRGRPAIEIVLGQGRVATITCAATW
ncbi:hypothetical protein CALCODRAFT_379023 [Calocera cornea HHB12733]|uniref:Uncharacterized protein n=1 Tax=Calocera cornea HHB12733 TaxID=1353952 RepID=A0A165EDL0_9BASI|nr:hypothetical protein CALCODRAFT_379023 [Calocera cornea HHB12733]